MYLVLKEERRKGEGQGGGGGGTGEGGRGGGGGRLMKLLVNCAEKKSIMIHLL